MQGNLTAPLFLLTYFFSLMISGKIASRRVSISPIHKVAIIGGGASGIITSHVLLDNGFDVTIYEQEADVGGVWRYTPESVMYDTLRTNLPKEIMAYNLENPFNSRLKSYLRHFEVQEYLENFVQQHSLRHIIRFGSKIQSISKSSVADGASAWRLQSSKTDGSLTEENYDAVVVCNGHYNKSFIPLIKGIAHFKGDMYHSREYDSLQKKSVFAGKKVLVVGSKSSGTDMARELSSTAHTVYVSDRNLVSTSDIENADTSCMDVKSVSSMKQHGNLLLGGGIVECTEDGSIVLKTGQYLSDVDIILWCTGFQYDYPFINDDTLVCSEAGRRVRKLYHQLFSITDPTLALVGLPFAVVPFPMFYLQARWIAAVYAGRVSLPAVDDQLQWLEHTEAVLKAEGLYEDKYHYMGGSLQWNYDRFMIKAAAGILDDGNDSADSTHINNEEKLRGPNSSQAKASDQSSTTFDDRNEVNQLLRFVDALQEIYTDNSNHKPIFTGAPDSYRDRNYHLNSDTLVWTVSDPPQLRS